MKNLLVVCLLFSCISCDGSSADPQPIDEQVAPQPPAISCGDFSVVLDDHSATPEATPSEEAARMVSVKKVADGVIVVGCGGSLTQDSSTTSNTTTTSGDTNG